MLTEDISHLVSVHVFAIGKFNFHLSDLLPENGVLVVYWFLFELCFFEFVDQEFNISLDFGEFGDSPSEFFILIDKVLKMDVSEVVT